MCYMCLYILIFTIILISIFLLNDFEWANWITALSTLATAIIAGKALDTWKKEIDYNFISDLRKDLIKSFSDLYYTLDLHANYYATSELTLHNCSSGFDYEKEKKYIDSELAIKQRDVSKAMYAYILYKPEQKKFLENLVEHLNNYRNMILEKISCRIDIQNKRKNNEAIDFPKNNEIEKDLKELKKIAEEEMNKLKNI